MKRLVRVLAIPGALFTIGVLTLASSPIGAAVATAVKSAPVLCFWGFGDIEQPESMIEARRRKARANG